MRPLILNIGLGQIVRVSDKRADFFWVVASRQQSTPNIYNNRIAPNLNNCAVCSYDSSASVSL